MRQRKLLFAVFALLLLFAACKGESPTSPTTPPTTGTTGTTTPPSGASVVLTVSNANPLVSSQVTITATVTQNGNPVPNGTAVQFTSTSGTFTDIGATSTGVIKTTTNGVATATLTSGSAGAVTVTATVNNVSKSITLNFSSTPVTPPTPNTTPTISSIAPNTGPPSGGETITITGTNFRAPVRVVFTCEGTTGATPDPAGCVGQTTKDALVTGVTPTQITAIAPAFNVPNGKAVSFGITVFVGAGTSTETSIAQSGAIIYTSLTLTPKILTVAPSSGPIDGGTRVTIMGDSFQAPVQVFFGSAEAQVISVNFNQIIALTPKASDTAPTGSGTIVGPVDVRVRNINSGPSADATLASGFRYTPKMQITTINPTSGPITGGTHVTIDGTGFVDPVAVTIAGVSAQVIRVSGTEVVAVTVQPASASCSGLAGPVTVTNTNNGDSAASTPAVFTFLVPQPQVVSATSPVTPGGTTTVVVLNAQGIPRILIGDIPATITATATNPDGTTSFTVVVPTTLTLATVACPAGVNAPTATQFSVTYTSLTTGCTNTFANGLTVIPPATPTFTLTGTMVPFVGSITPATVGPPATPATVSVTPTTQTVTIVNTGNATLTVNSITQTNSGGTGCARFSPPPPTPASLIQCDTLPITVSYSAPTTPTATADVCVLTITTNAGTKQVQLIGSAQ